MPEDRGDGQAVDVEGREVDAGSRGHVRVMVEHPLALRRDRAIAISGLEREAPIPPEKRGARHEGREAVAEREGGDHEDNG